MKKLFELSKAIPAAFAFLWARNLKQRAEGDDYRGRTYYVCAVDVEEQVRCFADDELAGKPWGTTQGYGRGFHNCKVYGDLPNAVRRWLLSNCDGHNFGRGHISGMRFRPRGEPIGPAEKTLAKKAADRANPPVKPVHFSKHGGFYNPHILCTAATRSRFSNSRSKARASSEWASVTCKKCLNLREGA
jgi:hypothetical protein